MERRSTSRLPWKTRRRWYGREHPLVVEVEECLADILADTCADTAGWDYLSSSVFLVLLLLLFVINCVLHRLLGSFFSSPSSLSSSSHPLLGSLLSQSQYMNVTVWWRCDVFRLRQRLAVELYRHTVHVKDQDMKLCPPTSPCLQAKGCSLARTLVKLGN